MLLAVPDEEALGNLAGVLRKVGIATVLWREPDWENTLTALAAAPSPLTRRLLANYPLTLKSTTRVKEYEGEEMLSVQNA